MQHKATADGKMANSEGKNERHLVVTWFARLQANPNIHILVLAAILAFAFSVAYPDSFPTSGTLKNMARVASILLVVSIGQSFALIVGGFDISVGSTMGLVSIVLSILLVHMGYPLLPATILGVTVGALVGLANGIIVSILNVSPFIATLGMLTFLRGLADQLSNGGSILGLPRALSMLGRSDWGILPSALCIAVIMLAIAWVILERTRLGLYLFSIGGAREASRIAGVAVARYEILGYVLCGTFAGIGGVMLTARVSIGQASLGQGFELLSIATAVIGGVAIGGGIGRLSGVVLGVILLTVLTTGLDIAGVNTFYQQMATGFVLVGAVALAGTRQFRRKSRA